MIGRPEAGEAASYYFTYIGQTEGGDPLALLRDQTAPVLAELRAISEETSLLRYEPGKWSVRELLNRVTDTERAFAFRALWFARGFDAPLPGYDQDIAVAHAGADRISWAAHVEEFAAVRASTIAMFENMPAEGWPRKGIASENLFTVRALAFIVAGHVNHHMRILRERYLPEQAR